MNFSYPLKTAEGTFFRWQDAWRDFGRTEAEIREEEEYRNRYELAEQKAAARRNKRLARDAERSRQSRLREEVSHLWGRSLSNTLLKRERLAPLSGYFYNSLLKEYYHPSWKKMTLRKLWKHALESYSKGIKLLEFDRATEGRYFREVLVWTENRIFGAVKRGELTRRMGDLLRSVLAAGFDELLAEKMDEAEMLLAEKNGGSENGFQRFIDTHAREDLYENELKKNSLYEQTDGNSEGIQKFSGKLPHRLWHIIRSSIEEFYYLHWDNCKIAWSSKHWLSWIKAALVSGKRIEDLIRLYDKVLHHWHGIATDAGTYFEIPYGMFSQLYRDTARLPNYRKEKKAA